jgi:uncharacterized membrane protein YeiB
MKPPKDASERIAVLDIQRGIAILLISLVNIRALPRSEGSVALTLD